MLRGVRCEVPWSEVRCFVEGGAMLRGVRCEVPWSEVRSSVE